MPPQSNKWSNIDLTRNPETVAREQGVKIGTVYAMRTKYGVSEPKTRKDYGESYVYLQMRIDKSEKQGFQKLARAQGKTLTDWVLGNCREKVNNKPVK